MRGADDHNAGAAGQGSCGAQPHTLNPDMWGARPAWGEAGANLNSLAPRLPENGRRAST